MLRKLQSLSFAVVFLILPAVCQQSPSAPSDAEGRIDSMLKQLTLEEKIDLIGGVDDFYIRANQKIGLPRLKMADGPVGVRNYGPSTVFGGIGLAASWDPELAERIGAVIGALTLTLAGSLLNFMRVSPDWQVGAQGAILIIVLAARALINRTDGRASWGFGSTFLPDHGFGLISAPCWCGLRRSPSRTAMAPAAC